LEKKRSFISDAMSTTTTRKKIALELTPQRQEAAPRRANAPPLLDGGSFS
jgi:hypothetical protein